MKIGLNIPAWISLGLVTLGLVSPGSGEREYSCEFATFRAPDDAVVHCFPIGQKYLHASAGIWMRVLNTRAWVSMVCIKRGSPLMGGRSPESFNQEVVLRAALEDADVVARRPVSVTDGGLNGELIVTPIWNKEKHLWQMVLSDEEVAVSVLWKMPTHIEEVPHAVIQLLNTLQITEGEPDQENAEATYAPSEYFFLELLSSVSAEQVRAEADEAWPSPQVLAGYERALTLYETGRGATGAALAENLTSHTLRLAPVCATVEPKSASVYLLGRVVPARSILARVNTENHRYATALWRAGLRTVSVRVIAVNLNMARQVAHTEPAVLDHLIQANEFWSDAWRSMSRALRSISRVEIADEAAACAALAEKFTAGRIEPLVQARHERVKGLSHTDTVRQYGESIRAELSTAHRLVDEWDARVDTPSCRRILEAAVVAVQEGNSAE